MSQIDLENIFPNDHLLRGVSFSCSDLPHPALQYKSREHMNAW
jgi:hypothetical protein